MSHQTYFGVFRCRRCSGGRLVERMRSLPARERLPLPGQIVCEVRPALMLLSVSVALVLLICCVHVACLLMGRAQTRRREISIRMAVGCTRFRIFRQFLTETTILGILGGVCGLAI